MGPRARATAARGLQLPPSGLSLPRGGRMWAPRGRPRALRPRNQPRPGACQSPAEPGWEGAVGGRTSGRAAGYPEPEPEQGRAALGAAQGGAGGAGGGSPVLTSAGAVHPGAGALRAGGSWRGGGLGRRPHIPPVAGGCRATVRRREEGRGPGGGGPWQPGRPGRMTMEGNALSEAESGPRGRGGREGAGARGPGTHHPGRRCAARRPTHRAAREAAPDPERGTRPRPARGRRPSRGTRTRAQFPETRLPERPQPGIHDTERTSMFTQGQNHLRRHFREGPLRAQVQARTAHKQTATQRDSGTRVESQVPCKESQTDTHTPARLA